MSSPRSLWSMSSLVDVIRAIQGVSTRAPKEARRDQRANVSQGFDAYVYSKRCCLEKSNNPSKLGSLNADGLAAVASAWLSCAAGEAALILHI